MPRITETQPHLEDGSTYHPLRPTTLDKIKNFHIEAHLGPVGRASSRPVGSGSSTNRDYKLGIHVSSRSNISRLDMPEAGAGLGECGLLELQGLRGPAQKCSQRRLWGLVPSVMAHSAKLPIAARPRAFTGAGSLLASSLDAEEGDCQIGSRCRSR